jgi:hypothetical protein
MHRMLIVLLLLLPCFGDAYIIEEWSYRAMFDQAELVVIAKPMVTLQTAEKTVLPRIIRPKIAAVGMETTFKVSLILKGSDPGEMHLHHYRRADPPQILSGIGPTPMLVEFNPEESVCFLMFLVRKPDGRYMSVTGQTNPKTGILKLSGMAQ